MENRFFFRKLFILTLFVGFFNNVSQAQPRARITSVTFIDDAMFVDESTGAEIYLNCPLPSTHLYVTISCYKSFEPQDSLFLILKKNSDTLTLTANCPFTSLQKRTVAKYYVGIWNDSKYPFPPEFYMNDWKSGYRSCANLLKKDFDFYYFDKKKKKDYHLKCPPIQMLIQTTPVEKNKFKESFCK